MNHSKSVYSDNVPTELPELSIGDVTLRVPIIQGGMGVGISKSGLASAVARAGALGVISAVGLAHGEKDMLTNYLNANIRALRREIRVARDMSGDGILGVNIMVALSDYSNYVKASVEEGIDVIFSGAGLPLNMPEFVPADCKTKMAPIISSPRAATIICKKWMARYGRLPDCFVVEGPMAGGHLGFRPEQLDEPEYQLHRLMPETIAAVRPFEEMTGRSIPVIAAGGIFSGGDIAEYLDLGAAGVQLGTRFVATEECDASLAFKEAYVKSSQEDVIIINSPVGLPGRAISCGFTRALNKGKKHPVRCPYKCLITCEAEKSPYCIALALLSAQRGNFEKGFAFAGANVYRVNEILTVQQLIDSLAEEYSQARCQTS